MQIDFMNISISPAQKPLSKFTGPIYCVILKKGRRIIPKIFLLF